MKLSEWLILLVIAIVLVLVMPDIGVVTQTKSHSEKLLEHFIVKELKVITIAADRNNCIGFDLTILYAIRKAEDGRVGFEFGITCSEHYDTNLDGQAACAAVTIVKNRQRWIEAGCKGSFIDFLGERYCPENSENWIGMVKFWISKLY